MKKKQKDNLEMKRRKSKNLRWTCCKRSAGTCALWRIEIVASVESILRWNVFKLSLEDGLTDRRRPAGLGGGRKV